MTTKKVFIYTIATAAYMFLVLLITGCGRDTSQPGAYRGRLGGGPVAVHKALSLESEGGGGQ